MSNRERYQRRCKDFRSWKLGMILWKYVAHGEKKFKIKMILGFDTDNSINKMNYANSLLKVTAQQLVFKEALASVQRQSNGQS
jgi:sRNA-binding regulator protein Hfq